MAFDFAAAKLASRRVVHETLGVTAFYQDSTMSTPAAIRVRWHSKIDRFGDNESAGYAEVIEGIHRVIFDAAAARALKVKSAGTLSIPSMGGARLTLEAREPSDGPFEEIWTAVKEG